MDVQNLTISHKYGVGESDSLICDDFEKLIKFLSKTDTDSFDSLYEKILLITKVFSKFSENNEARGNANEEGEKFTKCFICEGTYDLQNMIMCEGIVVKPILKGSFNQKCFKLSEHESTQDNSYFQNLVKWRRLATKERYIICNRNYHLDCVQLYFPPRIWKCKGCISKVKLLGNLVKMEADLFKKLEKTLLLKFKDHQISKKKRKNEESLGNVKLKSVKIKKKKKVENFVEIKNNHKKDEKKSEEMTCSRFFAYNEIQQELKQIDLRKQNIRNTFSTSNDFQIDPSPRMERKNKRKLQSIINIQKKLFSEAAHVKVVKKKEMGNENEELKSSEAFESMSEAQFNHLNTRQKKTTLGRSFIHTWGLFASEVIEPNDVVIEYMGEYVRPLVADLREKYYEKNGMDSSYFFRVDEDVIIDATMKGNFARYVNHSCDPNCFTKTIVVNNQKRIVIYSKKRIQIGDELTYDYKFPIEEKKIPCLCGAKKCRKWMN